MSNNTHDDDHSFKDSFTPQNPFVSNNLPNKFAAKHIKLLSFLKWFHDNNLNLHDFLHHDTHTSLYSLHRFLDFESQFNKRFKSFLKHKTKLHKLTNTNNNNNNNNNNPLYLSNTTNVNTDESKLIDTEIINIDDTDYLINITDNIIYNIKTHEKIGTYNSSENKIII